MKILAVLQNQWFRDPERIRAMLAGRTPSFKRAFCARALFAGCRTGQVLREVFGDELCRRIVWENASPEIGGVSSAKFKADIAHLEAALDEVRPDVVLAFGAVARDALIDLVPAAALIHGPHPTARYRDVMPALRAMRNALDQMLAREVA